MTTVFLSSKFIFRRLCTFTLRKLFTLLTLNINSTRSRERRNVVLLFVFVKVLYQYIFCRIILRRLSGRVKLRKLRMSLKYTLYLYLKSSVNTWQVCFQRTHILNKTHISKWGLNEPPRFENQVGENCFPFQCLFPVTADSQTTWFPKKSFEGN